MIIPWILDHNPVTGVKHPTGPWDMGLGTQKEGRPSGTATFWMARDAGFPSMRFACSG